nr:fimbria/pilus outer membrane usher protein [Solimonas terrae]
MQVLVGGNGHDYAWSDNLRDAGIGGLPPATYVDLGTIAGLHYRIDTPSQQLDLDADELQRPTQQFSADVDHYHAANVANGALLNYALAASTGQHERDASAFTDWRAFGDWGVLDSTALSAWHEQGESAAYRRLDTTYRWSSPEQLWTLSAGDFISGALNWSRPTRFGGLQWRRDYGLQPGLITFPLPTFFGQAALPSTLELYVNGLREFSADAQPGPFRIDAVPHLDGAGSAQLVVTDALGRRSVIDYDFYSAQQLLRAGYFDYSLDLGFVRRDYGLASFSYDPHTAASGSLRYGLGNRITVESHAEASEGLALAGGGFAVRVGQLGVISGAGALSRAQGRGGRQFSAGHSWSNGRITTELSSVRASSAYRDLATRDGRAPPRATDRAVFGLGFGAAGSASLAYTRLIDDDSRFRYASLQYSWNPASQLSLYVGYSRDLDTPSDDLLYAGLSWSFDRHLTAGLDVQAHDHDLRSGASLVQPLSPDGGHGWNVRAQHGDDGDSAQGEIAWRADWGQLDAGIRQFDGSAQEYGSLEGSLVFMDRDLFAARRIDNAFALISTDGIGGVPVAIENRPIGTTDGRGHFLLTDLRPWQANRISIDTLGLPAQVQTDTVRLDAVPAAGRGVRVDFKLRIAHAALVTLRDGEGRPLPIGSHVQIKRPRGGGGIVGYDGQAYLEDLDVRNTVVVVSPDGSRCHANFTLDRDKRELPELELSCR